VSGGLGFAAEVAWLWVVYSRMAEHGATMSGPLLETLRLCKSYPGVQALSAVDFELRRGEVHALVGENGAGKSTLARVICGLTVPDSGELLLRGRRYSPVSRQDAASQGVRMVMQELNLIGTLTVAENIFMGRIPRRLGFIDYRRMDGEARRILGGLGLDAIRVDRPVSELGVGQQQMVELASVLSQPCDVLILDEPTAALTSREIEILFDQIRFRRHGGVGIIYISHRMEEIKRIADRITVLRDGGRIATRGAGEVSIDEVIRLMVGRELGEAGRLAAPMGGVALRVENLRRGRYVRGVSFKIRRGEILGFAGLMGSGRTETMRLIFGADAAEGGEIYLGESVTPARIRTPRDAVRQGIALLTEDRKQQGLLLPRTLRENITLTHMGRVSRWGGWISGQRERRESDRVMDRLRVRRQSIEQPVVSLSGGNQQKIVVAKWLWRDCPILIFDEPTRGIDIGAKFEIYRLLSAMASAGKAIIVVSSDLMELMAICDRIAVMSRGRLVSTFNRGQWTEDRIMAAALSGYMNHGGAH